MPLARAPGKSHWVAKAEEASRQATSPVKQGHAAGFEGPLCAQSCLWGEGTISAPKELTVRIQ